MSSDPFIVEAPPPGAVFWEEIEHPDNVALLEGDERARELTRKQIKQIRRKRKEVQKILEAAGYDSERERYLRLAKAFQRAKEALHVCEEPARQSELKWFMERCWRAAQRIADKLEPFKPQAALRWRINARAEEHRVAVANRILYRKLSKQMQEEVNYFREQVIRRWSALGYKERIIREQKEIIRRPQIEEVWVTEDEIHFKILVSRITVWGSTQHFLPENVRGQDLVMADTLWELSLACQRPVTSPHNSQEFGGEDMGFENGAWITIHRVGMNGGLFNYVELNQVLRKYNQGVRYRYPVPFGVRRGRKINYCFLDEHPHVFVDGQTFAGKTNAIVAGLCCLIQMHSPDEIRIALVDLKRGGDLNPFADIPHLIQFDEGNIIKSPEALAAVLERMVALMYARMHLISQITVDIKRYNQRVPPESRLPRIILVIDEYSATKMNKGAKALIDQYCVVLSTQARAAGIHLIIGNQQPYADTVPKEVRGNITFKLSGRQMTQGASMSALGTGRATRIDKIPGRMVCNNGHEEFDVQIAFATETDIQQSVEAASHYPLPQSDVWLLDDTQEVEPVRVFNETLVIELALQEYGGTLAGRKIWEHLKVIGMDVSLDRVLKTVKSIVAQGIIEHAGIRYEMKKPGNRYVLHPLSSQLQEASYTPIREDFPEDRIEDEYQEVRV